MAIDENQPLEVMISSRCRTEVRRDTSGTAESLTDLRRRAKVALQTTFDVGGERLFDVWVNEDERKQAASETWYAASERRARRADLVLVLFTGDSGSQLVGDLGVCHAEFQAAMEDTPAKVRIIDLRPAITMPGDIDEAFVADIDGEAFVTETASTGDEAVDRVLGQALAAVRILAHHGSLDVRRRSKSGSEIEWDRLSFDDRKAGIEDAVVQALKSVMPDADEVEAPVLARGRALAGRAGNRSVLFVCHGAPAGLGLPASREMVGQPFLRDHHFASLLDPKRRSGNVGPVHVIASPQSVTESQARRLLGFPDATVVKDSWGIWVSDAVQRIQLVLIDRCTSRTSTIARVQQAWSWLRATGEEATLALRADRRARIVVAMADP